MKAKVKSSLLLLLFLMTGTSIVLAQAAISPQQDSLLQFLLKNQADVKSLVQQYQTISFNWKQLAASLVGVIFLSGLTWKLWGENWLKNYVTGKAQEIVDRLSNLKGAKILVLTDKNGSDTFLRSFFPQKKFPNVRFEHIGNEFRPITDFEYQVVFINNDDNKIDKSVARQYFREDTALFYFGRASSWDFNNDTPAISRAINFANSRAQIYGNLMSSLEFLELVNPKIKNV